MAHNNFLYQYFKNVKVNLKSRQFKLWISEKFLGFDAVIAEKIKFENRKNESGHVYKD